MLVYIILVDLVLIIIFLADRIQSVPPDRGLHRRPFIFAGVFLLTGGLLTYGGLWLVGSLVDTNTAVGSGMPDFLGWSLVIGLPIIAYLSLWYKHHRI